MTLMQLQQRNADLPTYDFARYLDLLINKQSVYTNQLAGAANGSIVGRDYTIF
jgi:hypothetical protein